MKYDVECLFDELFSIMKANLNDRITKIQSEKDTKLGDANFNVPLIDDNAWFDGLDERTANFNPYVYYGIEDNSVIEVASAESSDLTIFFTVVYHNDGDDVTMYRKMLRYIRAMQEVSTRNFREIAEASNLKVIALNPQDVKDLDSETFHKIGGVSIQAAIS